MARRVRSPAGSGTTRIDRDGRRRASPPPGRMKAMRRAANATR
ncbi:hypothetical protein C7S16_6773 [Burkholderia thailandensis]|uniref:Uncharacterized protein n=1 Tax=Burkholderia thailandensis TaxID=57975 RepID=A0AAW9CKI2_BURTH|nr:hypothetical protein [Burkholderia thailandensis]MDW9251114.1 hypothetical protein [Burkholderia thailandensis]